MGDNNRKDTALRQAIGGLENDMQTTLPSNFAFTTMRRIEAERQRAARRNRLSAVISLTMICLIGLGTFVWLCADKLVAQFHLMAESHTGTSLIANTMICLTFFSVLNAILRKHFKQQE